MLMKKTLLLVMLTAFASLAATAQVVLGDAKWSIRDGAKVNPAKTITIQFPNINGVDGTATISLAGNLFAEGEEATEDNAFDGIEANVLDPVAFSLADFEVVENTSYTLKITSVKVDGVEAIGDTTFVINFKTRGAERLLSWTFTIDEESAQKISASVQNNARMGEYWWDVNGQNSFPDYTDSYTTSSSWSASNNDLRFYTVKRSDEPLVLPDGGELPMTEGLTFTCGNKKIYVGNTASGKTAHKDRLAFNANNLYMTVPDCKVGDIITINANRSAKASATKFTCIVAMDGAAEAIDGITSSSGMKDSLQLGSSFANFKFTVLQDGDVTLMFSNALVKSLEITEARPIVDCTYSVKAIYKDGDNVKELKTLVPETVGKTNDVVKVNYSYWLTDEEGNLYTYGTKGSEFTQKFDLVSDTTFVINYKKVEGVSEVKFLAEAEDWVDEENLESVVQYCTNANSAVRSSNCKAAYATADWTVATLPAGTYKIKAVLFDSQKTASFVANFAVGTEEIPLAANSTNFAEVESEPFEVTEETNVIWKAGGSENYGIDILVIYATDELPEPDYEPGDVNGDNVITMADANAVVNYFLANDEAKAQMLEDGFNFEAADVNLDGDITMADANAIVNIFLGVANEGEKE